MIKFYCTFLFFITSLAFSETIHYSMMQIIPNSIDPLDAVETNSQLVVTNSFDGLIHWSDDQGIVPMLAQSWSFKQNKREIIFKLRENLFFTNGDLFSAKDVKAHFDRLLKNKYFGQHYENIEEVNIVNDREIVFKLKRFSSQFINLLGGAPARIVKILNNNVIGVGPFIPLIENKRIVLKRSKNYWDKESYKKSNLDSIEFKIINDNDAISLAKINKIDDLSLIVSQQAQKELSKGNWIKKVLWSTWLIGFDQRVWPLEDIDVRKYLSKYITSSEFVKELYENQLNAYGLFSFGMPGYLNSNNLIVNKTLLIDNSKMSLIKHVTIELPKEVEEMKKIKTWINSKIPGDIKPKIILSSFSDMISRYANGKMGAFLLGINAEYPDINFLIRSLKSNSKSNFLGIRSKQLDKWIDESENEIDPIKRAVIHQNINKYLMEQHAFIPLMHLEHRVWTRKCVKGLKLNPVNEGYSNYREIINTCGKN